MLTSPSKTVIALTRWLLSQLVLKFTQASMITPFEVRYSTVKRDSGLLDGYQLARKAIKALDDAWSELKELGALNGVNKSEQRGARAKLEDVIYTLFPSREFMAEQKAANHRLGKSLSALANLGPALPFNKANGQGE